MAEDYLLRDRFYDQAMFALCNQNTPHWPFNTLPDVANAINTQLRNVPPSADIFSKIIDAAFPSDDAHSANSLPNGFINELKKAVSFPLTPDKKLGMLASETSDFFFDLFSHYKEILPDENVGVVEVDISNMGGANDAIGRDNVTDAVAVMNRLYVIALTKPGRFLRHGEDRPEFFNNINFDDLDINQDREKTANVIPVRKGGDELRYCISGISEAEIQDRVKLANRAIAAFTSELGTDKLQHTKYKDKPDEAEHAGFGAGAGIVMLQPKEHRIGLHELQETLDNAIDADKAAQGKAKGLALEELESADVIKERLRAAPDLSEKIAGYKSQLADPKPLEEPKLPRSLFGTDGKNTYDIYLRNTKKAKNAFKEPYGSIFEKVVEQFVNIRDPITKMRTHSASLAQLALLKNVEPEMGKPRPIILEIELSNLQGLNKTLNHQTADDMIRQFADIVRNDVTDNLGLKRSDGDVQFYSAGGGKVRVLIHNHELNTIKHTISEINDHVAQKMNSLVIEVEDKKEIAVKDIPHPKDSELPETMKRKGVGIGYVALETHPEWSEYEHLDITDLLMEKPVRHKEGLIRVLGETRDVAGDAHWITGVTNSKQEITISRGLTDFIAHHIEPEEARNNPATGVGGGSASDDGRTNRSPLIVSS